MLRAGSYRTASLLMPSVLTYKRLLVRESYNPYEVHMVIQ